MRGRERETRKKEQQKKEKEDQQKKEDSAQQDYYPPNPIYVPIYKEFLNFFKFSYGINYNYEGILAHSFDRFYVVTKFILPTVKDLKFSTLNFNDKCEYLQEKDKKPTSEAKEHILDLITYCRKIKP